MTRFALGVEYDGTGFAGWQKQAGVRTVQETVEEALSRVADGAVRVAAAGRTDTGVHAFGQVIHFDCEKSRSADAFRRGGNAHLPADVSLVWAQEVSDTFHARFSAHARTYRYVILNRPTRPAVWAGRVTFEYRPLDAPRMQEAAMALIGRHDFSAYRAAGCQAKSPIREVHALRIERRDAFVILTIRANAFLHHMVRNIAGVLMAIGAGEQRVAWAGDVLAGYDRNLGGVTAPADGLYFLSASYPPAFGIPCVAEHEWSYGGAPSSG
ncbi:MAG: tRNA pseudouridine(38-40) synthase TruA [Gammaproteobacteria bacterium]|nr:tRNA pseudouridine(38-40) synthase TruA [Gammaproteobacteria bacterium]